MQVTCLGILYSHVVMHSVEGEMSPDTTSFLLAGTQVCLVRTATVSVWTSLYVEVVVCGTISVSIIKLGPIS